MNCRLYIITNNHDFRLIGQVYSSFSFLFIGFHICFKSYVYIFKFLDSAIMDSGHFFFSLPWVVWWNIDCGHLVNPYSRIQWALWSHSNPFITIDKPVTSVSFFYIDSHLMRKRYWIKMIKITRCKRNQQVVKSDFLSQNKQTLH